MKKRSSTIGLCVLFASLLPMKDLGAQERIRLAYSAISGAMLTPWVALESGIFKKNRLEVELVDIAAGLS